MITTDDMVEALDRHGIGFHTGVPCSYLGGPIARLSAQGRYVPAANEGAALAMAAGAVSGGLPSAVYAQNSGLGNMVNPLTSLLMPYRLPVLVMMSLRGWPDPGNDEPQHRVMGGATHRLLDTLGVAHWTLRTTTRDVEEVLDLAAGETAEGRPAFVLVEKGAVGGPDRDTPRPTHGGEPTRAEGIAAVLARFPDALVVATTGYTARELFGLADSERCFYMQGSMGHASAFGLGVALAGGGRHVVVLDGDGAALMHLGSLSTVGAVAPPRLVHVIFDNRVYESTGGQATTADTTSFVGVGRAVGYRHVVECRDADEVNAAFDRAAGSIGPHLVVIRTAATGPVAPPRATSAISAPDIHTRFAAVART